MIINPLAARKAAGLTQTQAAALIGAKMRTWQCWEGGSRIMPPAKYALFCIMTGYVEPSQPPAATE